MIMIDCEYMHCFLYLKLVLEIWNQNSHEAQFFKMKNFSSYWSFENNNTSWKQGLGIESDVTVCCVFWCGWLIIRYVKAQTAILMTDRLYAAFFYLWNELSRTSVLQNEDILGNYTKNESCVKKCRHTSCSFFLYQELLWSLKKGWHDLLAV